MFTLLQNADVSALIWARSLVSPEYTSLIRILGEMIVLWGAGILLFLWFRGLIQKDIKPKQMALEIFFTIVLTFIFYGIINFGVPQWRKSPQEVVGGIKALIAHPIDNSFPSGHALFTAALIV